VPRTVTAGRRPTLWRQEGGGGGREKEGRGEREGRERKGERERTEERERREERYGG